MAIRKATNKKVDQKVFRKTAKRTRKINVQPVVMRGGIRL